MTLVLVHGVPESADIWEPLLGELATLGHREVVRLAPPGFGAPLPNDFGAGDGHFAHAASPMCIEFRRWFQLREQWRLSPKDGASLPAPWSARTPWASIPSRA